MITYQLTTVRKVKDVVLRAILYRLATRAGYMRYLLYRNPRRVPIVIAFADGLPVGWAFLENGIIGVYVDHLHRRTGIGTTMVKNMMRIRKRKEFYVSLHNETASQFFGKFSAEYFRHPNRDWMLNGKIVVSR